MFFISILTLIFFNDKYVHLLQDIRIAAQMYNFTFYDLHYFIWLIAFNILKSTDTLPLSMIITSSHA